MQNKVKETENLQKEIKRQLLLAANNWKKIFSNSETTSKTLNIYIKELEET